MPVMERHIDAGTKDQSVAVGPSRLCDNPHLKDGRVVTAEAFRQASEAQPELVEDSHTEAIGPEMVCAACGACAMRDLRFRKGADCQDAKHPAGFMIPRVV